MVYTLTLNPAIDYKLYCKDINTGLTNRAYDSKISAGGKGINVSLMLNNLGTENIAFGFCAGFTGDELIRELSSCGLKCDFVNLMSGMTRVNLKLISDEDGTETEINAPGPIVDKASVNKLLNKLDALKRGDILVMSGSVPPSLTYDIYFDIMKRLEDRGVIFITDVAGSSLSSVLAASPYLVKPNIQEVEEFFGVKIRDESDAAECAVSLKKKGASNVIISLGKNGSVYASDTDKVYRAYVPESKSNNRSASGAGDSMIGGFLYAVLNGYSKEEIFRYANAAGCATAVNGSIAEREIVLSKLEQVQITEL